MWHGVVWRGMVWRGVAWCVMVCHGVVWCGMVWCGVFERACLAGSAWLSCLLGGAGTDWAWSGMAAWTMALGREPHLMVLLDHGHDRLKVRLHHQILKHDLRREVVPSDALCDKWCEDLPAPSRSLRNHLPLFFSSPAASPSPSPPSTWRSTLYSLLSTLPNLHLGKNFLCTSYFLLLVYLHLILSVCYAICCLLLAVCYVLRAIGCLLLTVDYFPLAACCLLLAAFYLLLSVYCWLPYHLQHVFLRG